MPLGATKVEETCTQTVGLGNPVLLGNTHGHRSFDDADLDGIEVYYLMENLDLDAETGSWEAGEGTWASGTGVFTRTNVLDSTTGSKIDFPAGEVRVSVQMGVTGFINAADNLAIDGGDPNKLDSAVTCRTNLGLGDVAVANEGAGNGLDADTVDDKHAAELLDRTSNQTGFAGEKTFTGTTTLGTAGSDKVQVDGKLDCNRTGALFRFPGGADKWAT